MLWALRKPLDPEAALDPSVRAEEGEDAGRSLACAFCLRPVTSTAARIEVDGSHEHDFVNPHGFRFRIGCFSTVIGCIALGEPTSEWTWFPGYRWQIEQCGNCREHLGWQFRSSAQAFHGLVLDRLLEVEDEA